MGATLVAIVVALTVGFASGWKTHQWRTDSAVLKETQKTVVAQDNAAVAHEEFKAKEVIKYRTIIKKVDRIVKEPFYLDGACLDDNGVRAINEAISGAASQPSPALPASAPS